ncbi:MAG: valine--tRNA ligase [Rickettsiales bacterium]
MTALPGSYDTTAIEKKWQAHWLEQRTYAWNPQIARAASFVIDTPPPTVSGTLHMGHVFSYTQADFIARFQRMNGKNVFYPMGFDDNGLPTERLVEKTKKIRASDMSREAFIAECLSVSEEARAEFRTLFRSIALSVDWDQEYHTISDASRRLSQLSFLDLVEKNEVYRAQRPFFWDPVDQTAIASAEIEDKELPSHACEIVFKFAPNSAVIPSNDGIPLGEAQSGIPAQGRDDAKGEVEDLIIMTTRPELLPACVALFCHPDDSRYQHLIGKTASVPLFGFSVPILADDTVEPEKGTGLMMCCTFGDEADIVKWQKHQLPTRVVLNKFGKIDFSGLPEAVPHLQPVTPLDNGVHLAVEKMDPGIRRDDNPWAMLQGKKVSNADAKHPGARQLVIELLKEAGLLVSQKPITHAVKCAERSGAPLEILPTHQWFVKVTDKKDALTARAHECNWNPEWMRLRIEQWIEGLNQDWCISRQRYFGVPFPVWYRQPSDNSPEELALYASTDQLPVNPLTDAPAGYTKTGEWEGFMKVREDATNKTYFLRPDPDVMDTWATSSISPQLSAGAISKTVIPSNDGIPLSGAPSGIPAQGRDDKVKDRFSKLFPADLRPQAHEIIRTWAFYTLVKSHLHNATIPWHNLMISGWCLAEDKSKMSKSKGNVVTPVALIEERGTDAVRYWAGTSRLGTDTAFSPDLLKIGKKLVGKLWNATAFAAIHLSKLDAAPTTARADMESGRVSEVLDQWILSRLHETIAKATDAFTRYEYADALYATNEFFWADFCDNYLELIKKRVYNEDGSASPAAQQSAVVTLYHCLNGILKLYAPFTPHVTEELYSHIFADSFAAKGSLHAMGQWPKVEDYPLHAEALDVGFGCLITLDFVRQKKSQANKSIKYPVTELKIFLPPNDQRLKPSHTSALDDIKAAGNILSIVWETGTNTQPNLYDYEITLAAEADAA